MPDCVPRRAPAVYPRWRGEHFAAIILWCQLTGLSPLTRGTRASVV
ncbi:hypothetical protein [Escherichia coli IS1]|nr:hypothetical protein AC80_3390 [Escherichia coli 1-110-08_S4_C1]KDW74040.1 hypothetical protein AB14_2097 [Escherichia coli 1-392-07_S1_C1]KDW83779.1 hypothetical protein AB42_1619 [Escherichia coli 1-392-07_S1_C2]KEJ11577.1 hypothetical protein AB50_3087 [Escherichia coli 6-175-07_S1_C2]KEM52220.1 hypothetical protein AB79_3121 [Escherichia coli 6-175-07_S1_C3]CDK47915.1 hypothetical protein [Escherichia coli IS1]